MKSNEVEKKKPTRHGSSNERVRRKRPGSRENIKMPPEVERLLPDIHVSKLNSVFDKIPITVPFKDVIRDHYENRIIADLVSKLRSTDDPDEFSRLKKRLPAYILAIFKTKKDENGHDIIGVSKEFFESATLLQFDIDKLGEAQKVIDVQAMIWSKIPEACCIFVSPSGLGVRFIIQLNGAITDPYQYSKLYKQKVTEYSKILGVELDSTSDATRKWYYSHAS